jgi:hypothetical protein
MPQEALASTGPYLRYPQKGEVGRGAARRLYLGLQLQEPFRLLPSQPVLDLGRLTFDVTPQHHR